MTNLIPILLILSFAIIAFVYYRTSKSSITKDRKTTLYIITLIAPIIGLIIFFLFNKKANQELG